MIIIGNLGVSDDFRELCTLSKYSLRSITTLRIYSEMNQLMKLLEDRPRKDCMFVMMIRQFMKVQECSICFFRLLCS